MGIDDVMVVTPVVTPVGRVVVGGAHPSRETENPTKQREREGGLCVLESC